MDTRTPGSVEPISDQAARWAIRAASGPLTAAERRELDAWLSADPRQRGAYILARAQWLDLDRLAALHGPAQVPADALEKGQQPISRRTLITASAATIAAFGAGLCWLRLGTGPVRYSSGIGEVREVALPDGSLLLLNTATDVTVDFTRQRRAIHLLRGEALFEVAHDKARPFVVVADDTSITAIGTVFAVTVASAQIDVTVAEGVVELADYRVSVSAGREGTSVPRFVPRRVHAAEQAIVSETHGPEAINISPADAERLLAWRDGMVSFNGETLAAAVRNINRHNRRQIIVDDSTLASKPVVGVFRANDPDDFAAAAAAALKARAVRDGDTIRIVPAARKKGGQ